MTILLVDDSDAVRVTYAALLETDGHRVVEAASLAEARDRLAATRFDAAIVDLHLPDGLGTALFDDVRSHHPAAAIVLLSGGDAAEPPQGADLVLEKGHDPTRFGPMIEAAIQRRC